MKKANLWLYKALESSLQQNRETKKDWLRRLSSVKIAQEKDAKERGKFDAKLHMEALVFGGTCLVWQLEEIVAHQVERLQQMRKKRNRQSRKKTVVGVGVAGAEAESWKQ